MKYICICLSLCLCVFLGYFRTSGFSTSRVLKTKDINYPFEALLEKDVLDILKQPFYYLDKGKQCFVFQSQDQRYVLKLLDYNRFFKPYFFESVPLPKFLDDIRAKKLKRRVARRSLDFDSYKMAFEHLKSSSGLVYIHLNKTCDFKEKLSLINKTGIKLDLDLNDLVFILQKKATLFYKHFEEKKSMQEKQKLLDQYLFTVKDRCKKQIIDDDLDVDKSNWGVAFKKVLFIDVGRLYFDDKLKQKSTFEKEMYKATKTLRKYLLDKDTDLHMYFMNKLEDSIKHF